MNPIYLDVFATVVSSLTQQLVTHDASMWMNVELVQDLVSMNVQTLMDHTPVHVQPDMSLDRMANLARIRMNVPPGLIIASTNASTL